MSGIWYNEAYTEPLFMFRKHSNWSPIEVNEKQIEILPEVNLNLGRVKYI